MPVASTCSRCGLAKLEVVELPPSPLPEKLHSNCFPSDVEAAAAHNAVVKIAKRIRDLDEESLRVDQARKELGNEWRELVLQRKQLAATTVPVSTTLVFGDSICPRCGLSAVHRTELPEELHPGSVPSDSEVVTEVARAIREIDAESIRLGKARQELGIECRELGLQRDVLLQLSTEHKAILAPIRRVIGDMLSEIFQWCTTELLAWDPTPALRNRDNNTSPEWALSRVCSTWRAVALSTPRIWDKIVIPPRQAHRPLELREASLLSLLSLQLTRSAEVPLTIDFDPPIGLKATTQIRMLHLLFSTSHRWKDNIRIRLTPSDVESFTGNSHVFPVLKKLHLHLILCNDIGTIFESAPLLEELELDGYPIPIPALPWPQLKKITVRAEPFSMVVNMLPSLLLAASNLVELSLHRCPQRPMEGPPVIFPCLRSLTISDCQLGSDQLLRALSAPALQRLDISHDRSDGTSDQIISFLMASSSSLTHLILDDVVSHTDLVSRVLPLTPDVTHLDFSFPAVPRAMQDTFLQKMTCVQGPGDIVPQLAFFAFRGRFAGGHQELLNMLESRQPTLRTVEFGRQRGPTALPSFEELRKKGMDVKVN
ncbi:hypothetical protein C8J57DRAFT_1706004 [Mycena rebaudengoi]|nr:hypothetical protein C8J57DRAFT_1706004 [Mycena rebaudengoi]